MTEEIKKEELAEAPEAAEEIADNAEEEAQDNIPLYDDSEELAREFPELAESAYIPKDDNRYRELRALGLSPREALLATAGQMKRADNRSHLTTGVPRGARGPLGQMTHKQLEEAREVFSELDDAEIQRLYKKVTQ